MRLRIVASDTMAGDVGLFMGGTGVYVLVLFESGHLCRFDWPAVEPC